MTKSNNVAVLSALLLTSALIFGFQNCAEEYNPTTYNLTSTSPTPTPTVPPVENAGCRVYDVDYNHGDSITVSKQSQALCGYTCEEYDLQAKCTNGVVTNLDGSPIEFSEQKCQKA